MLKKTISFEDIDGNQKTEDFYFHVSKSNLIEMLVEKPETEEMLQKLAMNIDGRAIMTLLKEFMLLSVGKRDETGRRFLKSQEIVDDFRYSGAYDALYWELINDPTKANSFLESIIPSSMLSEINRSGSVEEIQKQLKEGKTLGEVVANLPDKDWAAKPAPSNPSATELPSSGRIDTVEGQVVTGAEPTPFPESLTKAVESTRQAQSDEQPAWLRDRREPTSKELLEMDKSEMALAFKMREEGKLNVGNKSAS